AGAPPRALGGALRRAGRTGAHRRRGGGVASPELGDRLRRSPIRLRPRRTDGDLSARDRPPGQSGADALRRHGSDHLGDRGPLPDHVPPRHAGPPPRRSRGLAGRPCPSSPQEGRPRGRAPAVGRAARAGPGDPRGDRGHRERAELTSGSGRPVFRTPLRSRLSTRPCGGGVLWGTPRHHSTKEPTMSLPGARHVRADRGTDLTARSWQTEAPLRMLMNNLDPEVAERPDDLVVYGGTGRAARSWEAFDAIVETLKDLEADETLLVQSGKPVGVLRTNEWAPRVLLANSNLVGDWATWPEFRRLEAEG